MPNLWWKVIAISRNSPVYLLPQVFSYPSRHIIKHRCLITGSSTAVPHTPHCAAKAIRCFLVKEPSFCIIFSFILLSNILLKVHGMKIVNGFYLPMGLNASPYPVIFIPLNWVKVQWIHPNYLVWEYATTTEYMFFLKLSKHLYHRW